MSGLKPASSPTLTLNAALKRRSSAVAPASEVFTAYPGDSHDLIVMVTFRNRILLIAGWQGRGDGVAIEIEGDGTVEIGAIDADPSGLEAGENVGFGKTEGSVESD